MKLGPGLRRDDESLALNWYVVIPGERAARSPGSKFHACVLR